MIGWSILNELEIREYVKSVQVVLLVAINQLQARRLS